jgi:hypothetical protein
VYVTFFLQEILEFCLSMGCINSKPVPSESKRSESIEFTEQESPKEDVQESKLIQEEKIVAKDKKKENEKFHVENETTNILYTKKESFSQNEDKANDSPPQATKTPQPVESPKSKRDSLEPSSEKKLKLSELLHAEKMKKTSGSMNSSGEV